MLCTHCSLDVGRSYHEGPEACDIAFAKQTTPWIAETWDRVGNRVVRGFATQDDAIVQKNAWVEGGYKDWSIYEYRLDASAI